MGTLFYQIAWNAIDTDKEIQPFVLESMDEHKAVLKQLAGAWNKSIDIRQEEPRGVELEPGNWKEVVSLPGKGSFQSLNLVASSKADLSKLWIEAVWDGHDTPAFSCPLPLLCGVSEKVEDVNSLPVTVDGRTVCIRWPMSFENGAKIRLRNAGDSVITINVDFSLDRKLISKHRFSGKFSTFQKLQSDEVNILTLGEVFGFGNIVGCIMQVSSRSDEWWGEGDPLIWLDHGEQPAWRGTGTEDYFGFAWCSYKKFQHPLRGQTNADASFAVMYRYHLLDTLPFSSYARFDFEAHGSGTGSMDYSTLVLWYSDTSSIND